MLKRLCRKGNLLTLLVNENVNCCRYYGELYGVSLKNCVLTQSCLTLWGPIDWSPPGFSVHGMFRGQEYWSGLPFPTPGDLPKPGIKCATLAYPALAGRFFTTSATKEAHNPTPGHISGQNHDSRNTFTPMFRAALFTIAKMWKQAEYPLTDEWVKMWYTYTMEYYLAIKRMKSCHFQQNGQT